MCSANDKVYNAFDPTKLFVFWPFYRDPRESRRFSENEHAYIVEGGAQQEYITLEDLLALIRYIL